MWVHVSKPKTISVSVLLKLSMKIYSKCLPDMDCLTGNSTMNSSPHLQSHPCDLA